MSDLPTGILLAAGAASRFGGPKLLARLHGTPVAVLSARALRAALPRAIAVVRPGAAELTALLTECGLDVVVCEQADLGMGASLACAVQATVGAAGWVVALADMPSIAPATIAAVAAALQAGATLAAPFHGGRRGHPVGLGASLEAELLALSGDAGARDILMRRGAELVRIDTDDPGVHADIDTPADLNRLS